MSTLISTIVENADYHANLLKSIAELEYAPTAFNQQTEYLAGLTQQLRNTEQKVKVLGKDTKKQRKEHEELRDSVARKFVYRMTGRKEKFAEKASKEEREYIDALELEMRERKNQEMLHQMITEGKQVEADLAVKSQKFKSLTSELDDLYTNIFGGTTIEFPRDDELENQLSSAKSLHDNIQRQLNSESQALNLLKRADQVMQLSINQIKQALAASQWDMYGGSTMADMMERDSLAAAGSYAGQAKTLVDQAQRTCPCVQPMEYAPPPHIGLLGDVFFDNFYSDYQAHKKIEAYAQRLQQVHSSLKTQISFIIRNTQVLGHDLNEAASVLEQCRHDLSAFRRETFFNVTSKESAPPPEYSPPPHSASQPAAVPPPQEFQAPVYSPPPGPPPFAGPLPSIHPEATQISMPQPDVPLVDLASPSDSASNTAMVRPNLQRWGSRNPYAAALAGEPDS